MATPLRVAASASALRRALPKSKRQYMAPPDMPEYVEPQLCTLTSEAPTGLSWVHEIKFDGYRIQAKVERGKCILRSRKGLDWTHRFPEIAAACSGLKNCILDGEICAVDPEGLPDFAGLQQALSTKRTGKLIYFIFDLLWLGEQDYSSFALTGRKESLGRLLAKAPSRLRYVEHQAASGAAMFQSACQMKLEGIVSKKADSRYVSGRAGLWTKTKCRPRQELVIGGWEMNGPSIARLFLGAYVGGTFHYLGSAGTGFNSKNAPNLLQRMRALEIPKMPFQVNKPSIRRDKHWCGPELVCEVAFETWTRSGKIRQASFKGLREDKKATEVKVEFPNGER